MSRALDKTSQWWHNSRLWFLRWQRPLKWLVTLISALLVLLFVWYLVQEFRANDYDLWTLLQQIGFKTVAILFGLYTIALMLVVWIWGSMMNHVAKPLSWPTHWYIYTVTGFARRLPGSLWHVAGRTVLYRQHNVTGRAVALGSGLEVAFMMMSAALMLLLCWPVIANHFEDRWQGLLLVVGLLLSGFIFLHPASWRRFRQLSGDLGDESQAFSFTIGVKWLLAYGMVWILGGGMVAFLANQLHPIPLSVWPAIVGVWVFSSLLGMLIILLPSGLGIAEISLTLMLSFYMPTPLAGLVALGIRIIMTLFEFLYAVIWWVGHQLFRGGTAQ